MAKVIFYFHAAYDQSDELIRAAGELVSHELFQRNFLQLALMTPRSSDLLAVPQGSHFLVNLDVVLEIVFPFGEPVRRLQPGLLDALAPLMKLVDRDQSHVVLGYHRTFRESGAKPVRYHYLMYRQSSYSRADYLDYYVHSHSQFGVVTPLADYYQNYLDQDGGRELADQLGLNAIPADTISELRFDSLEDYLFSDVIRKIGPAAAADEELFVDRKRCQSFSMDVLLDTRAYNPPDTSADQGWH